MTCRIPKRRAFTLVELLVAVGIIAMLLGLVAMSFPRFNEREQLTRAVDKLRTGLLTARLWAKRDQVVSGIKFLKDPNGMYYGYQFVQQPVLPSVGTISGNYALGSTGPISLTRTNVTAINAKSDYLVISGLNPHLVNSISGNSVVLASGLEGDALDKTNFRIIHGPIAIPMQEDVIFQPDSSNDPVSNPAMIYIDTSAPNFSLTNDSVLFLPTGNVINQGSGTIKFVVSQVLADPNASNETADVFLDCMSGTNRYISPN
jgi:prepilin-type N-terminal cleavage/methylation domain-containing protein